MFRSTLDTSQNWRPMRSRKSTQLYDAGQTSNRPRTRITNKSAFPCADTNSFAPPPNPS